MNKERKTARFLPASFLLVLIVALCLGAVGNGETAGASPIAAPDWTTPIPITTAAANDAPFGAALPVVRGAPNGKTAMVVYNRHNSAAEGNSDPWFSRSLDNGATWSEPKAIHTSAAESRQVHLDYAANGIAHVVWQQNKGLVYARERDVNSDAWIAPATLVAGGGNPGVTGPYIVASSASRLDVVWAEGSGGFPDPNIYHARSNNNGALGSWAIKNVYNSGWQSQFPAMVVTESGVIHLVWQENDDFFQPNHGTIKYSQGTPQSGNSVKWDPPFDISEPDDAREPEITLIGGALHVVYTEFVNNNEQYIRHVQCAGQCKNEGNWKQTANPISGQLLGANGADPLNAVSTLVDRGGCAIAYFHGTDEANSGSPGYIDNEIVWGVNSCDRWSQSARDQVTLPALRSINPNLDVQSNWWLYLAFEQDTEDPDNNARQIYFMRSKPDVYLPVMFKN